VDADLDNIILMAMRKEPARRYPSAAALAEDLNRYLNGQPVQARPDTTTYRFRKFVGRHRLAVGFTALVALLILGFGIAMAILARQVSLERDSAEQVSAFLGEIFQLADPQTARGREITIREALDQGAERLSKTLGDRPGVKSDLLHRLGLVYENLGQHAKSRRLLNESIALTRRTPGYRPLDLAGRLKAAAELARQEKDPATAIAQARESLEIRERLLGAGHPDTCESLNTLALALHAQGDLAQAERRFRKLLENRAPLRERPHLETAVLSNLGGVLYDQKRYAESEAALRELVEMRRKALPAPHPRIAMALGKLAKTLMSAGEYAEAEAMLRETLTMRDQLHGGRPHPDIANVAINLGHVLRDTGRREEAVEQYRRARDIRRALYPADHADLRQAERLLAEASQPASGR
jgi:serine/threonine-protein kinase